MSRSQRFLNEIQERVLVGDGALGTALFARGAQPESGVERLNLLTPDLVLGLHRDYVAAGSRVLETNTFGANRLHLARYGAADEVRAINLAGAQLARQAAGDAVYVAGSLGPLPSVDGEPVARELRTALVTEQVTALLEGGVDLLLFESYTALDDLLAALTVARTLCDLPLIAQMVFEASGYAPDGTAAAEMATRCLAAGATLVGANCGYGVPSIEAAITAMASSGAPMSAFMNAGFPEQVEGRQYYLATADYLARRAQELVALGVRLVGGCCGTDPATIRAIAQAIARPARVQQTLHLSPSAAPSPEPETLAPSALSTPFPLLVELDPPTNAEVGPVLDAAHVLKAAGATAVTVADNPLASARLDSITLAGLIQQATDLPTVPHLTGRDRNRLALQSALMAAHALGIRAVLGVTGDPVRMCNEPNTSGVFDVTSVSLVRLLAEFNAGVRMSAAHRTAFTIGVALNPNVRTLSGQIDKLARKVEAGAHFALTQPVFEPERLSQLQEALGAAELTLPIYIGILPLLSLRNAEFLHNEVPGITIPEAIRERMARYESPADQRAVGIEVAVELVQRFAPSVHGFYFMTPRNRVELVVPLLEEATRSISV
jgi:methionine synthase I (cobalamin-dependent)/5,10-methylenetetrahydrofolate reductase